MRRTLTVLAVLVVVIAVTSTAMAATLYTQKLGQMYIRPGGMPTDGAPVGMPGVSGSNNDGGFGNGDTPLMSSQGQNTTIGGTFTPGPVSLGAETRTLSRGTALVGPTGGSVYTPKQRADREIKGVIRKLR